MSFDNSRFTFNPWNDYFGVVMQQGRVQLDADWNDWLTQFARRMQAGTLDMLGLSGVPTTTPGAFQVTASTDASGKPHITFGVGRIYVEGLLAENRGPAAAAQWDALLGEWTGTPQTQVDYAAQPYLPSAPAIPTPPAGPYLVYLDVWQREVTSLADPNLVDAAVGVDTTGRLQTVWQVKFVDVSSVGSVTLTTPDSEIPPWFDIIQPSSSLLTLGVVPSASTGQCAISSGSGYTGLENQLYRVEIHQPGTAAPAAFAVGTAPTPGTATFKWSREDASIVALVTAIASVNGNTASQLTVPTLGRDQVLGFQVGNWIELINDALELNGLPGELHQIVSIDPVGLTITLDSLISNTSFPLNGTPPPAGHTRIRRWDQSATIFESDNQTAWSTLAAGAEGDIPVPPSGTALVLENGITVSFDLAPSLSTTGGTFATGDYWTFSARTADGSVTMLNQPVSAQNQQSTVWSATTAYTIGQIVTSGGIFYTCLLANTNQAPPSTAYWSAPQAPPEGIHHHYCRLAIIDFTGTPPTDCRQLFPPLANPAIHVLNTTLSGGVPFLNDSTVAAQALTNGINVVCDGMIDPAILAQPASTFNCPICFVTADLPASTTPPSGGFSPLTLAATVTVTSTTITWLPTADALQALESQIPPAGPPVLARLTLKGNGIWAADNSNVFLNGATMGLATNSGGTQITALQFPSGDGRPSADFQMWFWLSSQPVATLSNSGVLDFGLQAVGVASSPQTITLTNISGDPFTISSTSTSGSTPGYFSFADPSNTTVNPGDTLTISIIFTPLLTIPSSAQITILLSVGSPLLIQVTGTGIAAASLGYTPSSISFSQLQPVNSSSTPQIVTLTNNGQSPLVISSITTSTSDFTQTSTCISANGGGTLGSGASCQISVVFSPSLSGPINDSLVINTNAGNVSVPLTGTGMALSPGLSVSPTSLAFGLVVIEENLVKNLTLISTGNEAVTLGTPTLSGVNPGNFAVTAVSAEVLFPGTQATVSIQFTPTSIAVFSAQVNFPSSAGTLTVPLTGNGRFLKALLNDKLRFIEKNILEQAVPREPEISKDVPPDAENESGTRTAFITPEERPAVETNAPEEPHEEPPKEGSQGE